MAWPYVLIGALSVISVLASLIAWRTQVECWKCTRPIVLNMADPDEQVRGHLHSVEYLVEADSPMVHALWERYFDQTGEFEEWSHIVMLQVQVGVLFGRPICVNLEIVKIDGTVVGFYHDCSELVDHVVIAAWLRMHCWPLTPDGQSAHCNASNFPRCCAYIQERLDRHESGN